MRGPLDLPPPCRSAGTPADRGGTASGIPVRVCAAAVHRDDVRGLCGTRRCRSDASARHDAS